METHSGRPRVLIVDDAPENIQLLTEMLRDDCQTVSALNGLQALQLANADPAPDVILLDIMMPGMNGYEVCTRLKSEPKTSQIPIIFVTALTDKAEEHKGLELGAADFITRPFNSKLVKTRIRYQLEIKRFRALQETSGAHSPGLKIAHSNLQQELLERKQLQEELSGLNATLEEHLAAARVEIAKEAERHRLQVACLEASLLQQKSELDQVSKELETFAYSISHDLRAPLRHLLGFSSALAEDYGETLDETAQGFLNCITRAAHKMELQVEGLTSLSRIARQPLSMVDVDLTQVARDAVVCLKESSPECRVEVTVAEQLKVRGDLPLLRTLMDHLLGNAWKFTSKLDAATIEVGSNQEEGATIFFVRDNGAGFDMRYADRLFGVFQRMHKESEFDGLGIGLATVQRIVHRHGGRIWAEAEVNGGATFYFTLAISSSITDGL